MTRRIVAADGGLASLSSGARGSSTCPILRNHSRRAGGTQRSRPESGVAPLPVPSEDAPSVTFFGASSAVGRRAERTAAWLEFYQSLFGFTVLPSGQFFGVVNKGVLLESPCRKFFLQLIEPPDDGADAA